MSRLPVVGVWLLVASIQSAAAGVYSPDEKCLFTIRPDGTADELSFEPDGFGRWRIEIGRLADIGNPLAKRTNPNDPTAREKVEERIDRRKRARSTDPAELTALAVDLLRVRRTDEALNVLAPYRGGRGADFRVLATLAHVHAVRGEWGEAVGMHSLAREMGFPKELPGATPAQRDWLARIEAEVYPRWLRAHRQEVESRGPPADEGLLPLFDDPPPADALAVIQQLLLWHPDDARLHWLLADRYAAAGRPRQADRLFDELAEGRQQSNRRKLMDQRAAVKRQAADAMAAASAPPADPPPAGPRTLADLGLTPEKLTAAGAVAGLAVAGLLVLQVRAVRRRLASRPEGR